MKKLLTLILVILVASLSCSAFADSGDKYKGDVDDFTAQNDDVPLDEGEYNGIDYGDNDDMAIVAADEGDGTGEFD